jgi:penicillin-binding protein 1A
MTSLLRTAVAEGTGQAANIGRPVAGKTGTTSSGKDGWFIGFSSGITTGVWIGRDDAKPVPNLQGGRAPARIFSGFMRLAVKGRPVDRVENLEISENEEIAPEAEKENKASEEGSEPQENEDAPSYDAIREEALRRRPEEGKSRAVPMD